MKVVFASHVSDLSGPSEAFIDYLRTHRYTFLAILNPLEYCTEAVRSVTYFAEGKVIWQNFPINTRGMKIISWFIDSWIVFWKVLLFKGKIDVFIGCDPMNASIGAWFKKIHKVNTLVYYSVDWSESRFAQRLFNSIYYSLDSWSVNACDYNWCVSKALIQKRLDQNFPSKKLLLVPVGITKSEIPIRVSKFDKFTCVFIGALEKSKGIELIIDAWPQIKKSIPKMKMVVIGKTPKGVTKIPYEDQLKKLSDVTVRSIMPHIDLLCILPTFGIGLAPYSPELYSVTKYADPSRIRDYLVSGLPVITTYVPSVSQDIEKSKSGIIISYSKKSLSEAITRLVTTKSYISFRTNARGLSNLYDWNKIFGMALKGKSYEV